MSFPTHSTDTILPLALAFPAAITAKTRKLKFLIYRCSRLDDVLRGLVHRVDVLGERGHDPYRAVSRRLAALRTFRSAHETSHSVNTFFECGMSTLPPLDLPRMPDW